MDGLILSRHDAADSTNTWLVRLRSHKDVMKILDRLGKSTEFTGTVLEFSG